jgi:hypothetical protein
MAVIPAKAGIHPASSRKYAVYELDSRFRGNYRLIEKDYISNDTATDLLCENLALKGELS